MFFGQGTWRSNLGRLMKLEWAFTVPMVTDDVYLVVKNPQDAEQTKFAQFTLFLKPFSWGAWGFMLLCLVIYWIILVVIEVLDDETGMTKEDRELGWDELLYNSCISVTGYHVIEAQSTNMRVIQAGWIAVVFMLCAAYTANLTAFLVNQKGSEAAIKSLQECIDKGKVFCVNRGSANDAFFDDPTNPNFDSLVIKKMAGTAGQIQGLLDGECQAIELTLEDLNKWGFDPAIRDEYRCSINVAGLHPMLKRTRGMMLQGKHTCLATALNGLYFSLSATKDYDYTICGAAGETDDTKAECALQQILVDDASTPQGKIRNQATPLHDRVGDGKNKDSVLSLKQTEYKVPNREHIWEDYFPEMADSTGTKCSEANVAQVNTDKLGFNELLGVFIIFLTSVFFAALAQFFASSYAKRCAQFLMGKKGTTAGVVHEDF